MRYLSLTPSTAASRAVLGLAAATASLALLAGCERRPTDVPPPTSNEVPIERQTPMPSTPPIPAPDVTPAPAPPGDPAAPGSGTGTTQ